MAPKLPIAVLLIVSTGTISNTALEKPMEIMVKETGIKLSQEEKLHIVRLHNLYRSNATPPAANIRYMQWDEELAKTAQAWASLCVMHHGIPAYPTYHSKYGQNLYFGPSNSTHRAIWLWHNELYDYDLRNAKCALGRECGHYIQMMWWETKVVGCALAQCGKTKFLFVCHYSPQYLNNTAPYLVGEPCSLCDFGYGGLCNSSLCVTKTACDNDGLICECHLKCHNCGRINTSTCSCKCMDGWDSLDCSKQCKDQSKDCGKEDGYPSILNCPMYKGQVKNELCRKMCRTCGSVNISNLSRTCCDGNSCSPGYIIDLDNRPCSCRLLCPGPECDSSLGKIWQPDSLSFAIGVFVMVWELWRG